MIKNKTTLVIGANSGIAQKLIERLKIEKHIIHGSYRTITSQITPAIKSYTCDLSEKRSIDNFIDTYSEQETWDNLVIFPATMEPIGQFEKISINEWIESFQINFTHQVYLLHRLLSSSNRKDSKVLLFAGGGVNSAPLNYSCYTTSKISMIKLIELLDQEIKDISFSILGPGWVKTKIHNQSIQEKFADLNSYKETKRRILENDFVDMNKVIDSIMWILYAEKKLVGGRNFSTAHDPWGSEELNDMLSTMTLSS